MSENAKGNMPEKKFRAGGVVATVWKNTIIKDGDTKDFYTVDITNNYKVGEEWKTKSSYSKNDLVKVMVVTRATQDYLFLKTE